MKFIKYISYVLIPGLVMGAFLLTSCEENDGTNIQSPKGDPVIHYIRVPNPNASDSLIVRANLGANIAIMGENLGGIREIWFNDRRAVLTPPWVTNSSIMVNVPNIAPLEVTDKIYLIDANGKTLTYDFQVTIPPPAIYSAKNEWPQVEFGERLVINGDFFFDVDGEVPVVVTFTGGEEVIAELNSSSQLIVDVPEGAQEGPVTVTTNFGSVESTFHLWDSRNIVLDFDNILPNGWRIGTIEGEDAPVNGNYLVVRGNVDANQRDEGPGAPSESGFCMEYWGGNDPERTENFYPLYPNSYRDYVLKFEAKVKAWYGGHLNLCLSSPDHTSELYTNQEIWSNDLNARAIWAPWAEDDDEFDTGDQWITVVVPLTDFQYHMGTDENGVVEYSANEPFVEANAGSFSTWLLGSPESDGRLVEFYIDNIRFVQP